MDDGELLARLLARYSPSGRERGAVEEFVRCARELGYRTRVDAVGNGLAEVGRGHPLVLFLGHIDTVEGDRPVVRRRGRVHGRGAVDAKGALAAALLAGADFAGPGTWRVVAAIGEETDSRGARHLAKGRPPDFLLAGEPSGWDGVTIGYKGDVRLEVGFERPRTHWGSPQPTAADLALAWIDRLRAAAGRHSGPTPFRTPSVKVVGLASDPSADPEAARMWIDIRVPPGLATDDVLGWLPDEGLRPTVRVLTRIEPIEVARTDPVVAAVCAAIRAEGGRPTLWRKSGTSDLNLVGRAWGVGGAAYGPGDARLDHTSGEVLSVAELRRAARVLRGTLDRLGRSGALRPTAPAAVPAP
jgi:[amino group carrier protein]-lysine/ornithine hydrolase